MAAAFLPSILVPIVGLVFPALSMALFFIYVSLMILVNFIFRFELKNLVFLES
jgi:photosystem I subunit 8